MRRTYKLWFEDELKCRWYVLTVPESEDKDFTYTRKLEEALRVGPRWKARFLNRKRDLCEKAGAFEKDDDR